MAKKESFWKTKELEFLVKCVDLGLSDAEIANKIGRSVGSILHKRVRLKLKTNEKNLKIHPKRFSKDEENLIIELRSKKIPIPEIAKQLGRSYRSVKGKVYLMENKKESVWNEDKIKLLVNLYNAKLGLHEISKQVNKNISEIKKKIAELGIKTKKVQNRRWTDNHKNILISNLKLGLSVEEISYKLQKGRFDIVNQCKKMGIRKKYLQISQFLKNVSNYEIKIEKILTKRFWHVKNAVISNHRKQEFNLDLTDVLDLWNNQKGLCFYTGLDLSLKSNDLMNVSIDRIDSNYGYIKNNIVLCGTKINIMKSNLSTHQFFNFCYLIVRKMSENIEF